MNFFTLENCLILSFILFGIGIYGVIAKKNLLVIMMSIEIMFNAVNIAILSFSYFKFAKYDSVSKLWQISQDTGHIGHYFALIVIAVAAAEAAVGLAILITVFRNRKVVDTDQIMEMKN